MLCSCPCLENLSMLRCTGLSKDKKIISVPRLLNLKIVYSDFDNLEIDAPCLQSFEFDCAPRSYDEKSRVRKLSVMGESLKVLKACGCFGVLCKFFAHGACLKGDHCEFSHDWSTPQNNICTFYQKGLCAYGNRCRYDHVKVSRLQTESNLSSSLSRSSSALDTHASISCSPFKKGAQDLGQASELSAWSGSFSPDKILWNHSSEDPLVSEQELDHQYTIISASDHPICAFAAAGKCLRGENCPHIHGDLCETCGKHCLHPYRPEERNEHIKQCQRNQKYLEALRRSQEIECCVCLDRVLTKSTPAERKFGLLSECDHAFCISCIRNWRGNSPSCGMDVNSTLRACPICRKLSYFVIPSVIWYASPEEKQEIVDSYKSKLRSIDCKYFDFGNGNCPFGTSCFYKHAYRDGRIEEVKLRHLGAGDGLTAIAKDIRLSDFFRDLRL